MQMMQSVCKQNCQEFTRIYHKFVKKNFMQMMQSVCKQNCQEFTTTLSRRNTMDVFLKCKHGHNIAAHKNVLIRNVSALIRNVSARNLPTTSSSRRRRYTTSFVKGK